ncbi:unnamed protein product [Allacma fusca]|uniref:Uncharacterized protein n=1 Tax=Allacma fusca TaxID=39272 RepID=A0A8J2L6X8_9HEXA|nr:unnamed protein product [Allacma fusca]
MLDSTRQVSGLPCQPCYHKVISLIWDIKRPEVTRGSQYNIRAPGLGLGPPIPSKGPTTLQNKVLNIFSSSLSSSSS